MGRENSMTCRAKTYGNSFTEEGQKEKMEGSEGLLLRVLPSIFVIRKEPPSFTSVTTEGPFVNLGLASFS
jgi:hypothetical protein